ncbi:sensor histidine kinase [Labilibacter marinus]|uniref:sensor histidine kinase n=1 Tax=Labilibacter marinus TaxID=1477105 RepID=UPI0009F9BA5B|nr:ATP-binding protein [Labilibacter marinus]
MMIRWVKEYLSKGEYVASDGLNYWRERVFKSILIIIVGIGFVPYIFGMYMSFTFKVYSVAIVDTFVYASIIFIIFTHRIKLVQKIYFIVGLIFFIGVTLTLILGETGAGFNYIIGFSLLASLLLGLRGAINSLIITIGLIAFIAVGLHFNIFGSLLVSKYEIMHWLTVSINVFAVSAMSSIPLAVLVKGLESTIAGQKSLQYELKEKIVLLEEARNNAEEADKLKTKFLANMSHEVRTPLNSILGFSELMQNEMYGSRAEMLHYINTINKSGNYLLNIIENILDFSMIESSQLKHSIEPFDFTQTLKEIKQVYELDVNSKHGVDIVFKQAEQNSPLTLHSDSHRIKQVLFNLINNAIKFTDKGYVEIGYQINNNTLQCYVQDTGAGIESTDQELIFKRFVKIEGKNKVKDGTGLGLPISKGIIETLGGSLDVKSEVNKGSTFYFSLPLQ